jgi:hypothetical protein
LSVAKGELIGQFDDSSENDNRDDERSGSDKSFGESSGTDFTKLYFGRKVF